LCREEPPQTIVPEKKPQVQQQKSMKPQPVKRIFNVPNPFQDRMKLRQLKKVEMVDAWTQTSDHGSDNEGAHSKHRDSQIRIRKDAIKSGNPTNSSNMHNLAKFEERLKQQQQDPYFDGSPKEKSAVPGLNRPSRGEGEFKGRHNSIENLNQHIREEALLSGRSKRAASKKEDEFSSPNKLRDLVGYENPTDGSRFRQQTRDNVMRQSFYGSVDKGRPELPELSSKKA